MVVIVKLTPNTSSKVIMIILGFAGIAWYFAKAKAKKLISIAIKRCRINLPRTK
jgi:hypothetical protein